MLLIFILGLIAVVSCVVGVTFILKGAVNTSDTSREDLEKVKVELEREREQEKNLKLQMDKLVIELDKTREELKTSAKGGEDLSKLKEKEADYQLQMDELKKNLQFLQGKADRQAQEAIDVIKALSDSNQELGKKVEEGQAQGDPKELEVLKVEKKNLTDQVQANMEEIKKLQEALSGVHQGSEELNIANRSIEELKVQNQRLKDGLVNITSKISEVEKEVVEYKEVQEALLKEANARVLELDGQITPLRDEINKNNKVMQEMEASHETAGKSALMGASGGTPLAGQVSPGEEINHLKAVNSFLIEKEKLLQQELTRSRAKALSLDKICNEYKKRVGD